MKPHAILAFSILLIGCPRTNPGDPAGSGGADAATATSTSDAASTGGGSEPAPAPACIDPVPRPADYACRYHTDCYDRSQCTAERCVGTKGSECGPSGCDDGRCVYTQLEGGCDEGVGWRGVCRSGSCCPRETGPAGELPVGR